MNTLRSPCPDGQDRQIDSSVCHTRVLYGVTDTFPKGHSEDIPHQVKGQRRTCLAALGSFGERIHNDLLISLILSHSLLAVLLTISV